MRVHGPRDGPLTRHCRLPAEPAPLTSVRPLAKLRAGALAASLAGKEPCNDGYAAAVTVQAIVEAPPEPVLEVLSTASVTTESD